MRHFIPQMPYTVANIISVLLAIIFAYFTNSRFVFRSKAQGLRERFGEFVKFFGARLSTLIIEVGGVAVMNEYMNINDRLGKFIVQFIVLVLNYIFSKFLVFKKR
jgi:putative flippase GtrA